ncbi:MAG: cyclic pyranopterin monophosphate synthase MoaC [Limnobacter sp.]|nr:cyclic pyranopterin monophosphate synthase MoaC [Limnobacter sp.]
MVNVGDKPDTQRTAIASGSMILGKNAFEAVKTGNSHKGDVLGVARLAAIMGAKRTSELVPLCHPVTLSHVSVGFELKEARPASVAHADQPHASVTISDKVFEIVCTCTVQTTGKTGVEMEALTGVQIGLLTLYDMLKAIDKNMVMHHIRLIKKTGGKTDFATCD